MPWQARKETSARGTMQKTEGAPRKRRPIMVGARYLKQRNNSLLRCRTGCLCAVASSGISTNSRGNMMSPAKPTAICEEILRSGIRYNIEHQILPSENAVAERLLSRRAELIDVYNELHEKLHDQCRALESFLGTLLSAAAFWSPDKLAATRKGKERLEVVNREIATKAADLAGLLDERSDLHNHSQFYTDTHYDVCGVIEAAARDNYLFDSWVREKLANLSGQFDLKYWPTLGDFVRELATDADKASALAADPLTAAGTSALRPSLSDFFKALFAAILENSCENYGAIPNGLKLTDSTYASLANCALGLSSENLVDSAYVKRLRQRQREVDGKEQTERAR